MKLMSARTEIGGRLRQFGLSKFNTMAEFARELKITPQQLNHYLSGRILPGNKMEQKLHEMGCDIIWLEHGATKKEMDERFSDMVSRLSKSDVTEEEKKILTILRGLDIVDVYEFEQYFDTGRAAEAKLKKLEAKLTAGERAKKSGTRGRRETKNKGRGKWE